MLDKPPQRKSLTDILRTGNDREGLSQLWRTTAAAEERGPLPPGEYTVRILSGELFTSKRNATPGYKLTCEVTEGEHESRRLWLDFWLTPAALPMTKRDLAKIGVERPEQLEQPLPPGILLKVKVTVRRDDDGNDTNKVIRMECVGVEPGDAFEPKDEDADRGGVAAPEAAFPFGAARAPADDGTTGKAAQRPGVNGAPPVGTKRGGDNPKGPTKADDAAGMKGGTDQ